MFFGLSSFSCYLLFQAPSNGCTGNGTLVFCGWTAVRHSSLQLGSYSEKAIGLKRLSPLFFKVLSHQGVVFRFGSIMPPHRVDRGLWFVRTNVFSYKASIHSRRLHATAQTICPTGTRQSFSLLSYNIWKEILYLCVLPGPFLCIHDIAFGGINCDLYQVCVSPSHDRRNQEFVNAPPSKNGVLVPSSPGV